MSLLRLVLYTVTVLVYRGRNWDHNYPCRDWDSLSMTTVPDRLGDRPDPSPHSIPFFWDVLVPVLNPHHPSLPYSCTPVLCLLSTTCGPLISPTVRFPSDDSSLQLYPDLWDVIVCHPSALLHPYTKSLLPSSSTGSVVLQESQWTLLSVFSPYVFHL